MIQQLCVLITKTLWYHLAAHLRLATSSMKPTLAHHLFNAMLDKSSVALMQLISPPTNPPHTTVAYNFTPLASSQVTPLPTTSISSHPGDTVNPGNFTPAQVSPMCQFYCKHCKQVLPLNNYLQLPCPCN